MNAEAIAQFIFAAMALFALQFELSAAQLRNCKLSAQGFYRAKQVN